MRDKLRALYYPDSGVAKATLLKSILLFDEIHFMDRPSFTFYLCPNVQASFGMIGSVSPLRSYEESFRQEGVPLWVHGAPGGPLGGELLEAVKADVSDKNFLMSFQEGLRKSDHFLNLHIPNANYGVETQKTIAVKVTQVDLGKYKSPLDVYCDPLLRPFEFSTEAHCLKNLITEALTCSAKMNFALNVGTHEGFSPLADASPFNDLLKNKYSRALSVAPKADDVKIPPTELCLAVMDELVRPEVLHSLSFKNAIEIRKNSEKAREAFLEHLVTLQGKLGGIPDDGDYAQAIKKVIETDVRPAAREFQNQLATITDKIVGALAIGAVSGIVGSSVTMAQVLGGLAWPALLTLAGGSGIYLAKQAADAIIETRKARRDCAISYLLDLDSQS